MTIEEFNANIRNVKSPRKHTIINSVGLNEFIQQYKGDINKHDARKIIKSLCNIYSDYLATGEAIKLPQQIGNIEIRHFDSYVKLQNGKVKTNRCIDWKKTIELWYNDTEAKENKTLIRTEDKKIFRVFYNKAMAKYNNKVFIKFIPNRTLKQKIKKNIQNNILIDSFKLS